MFKRHEIIKKIKFECEDDKILFWTDSLFEEGEIRKYIIERDKLDNKFKKNPILLIGELCKVNYRKREIFKYFLKKPRKVESIETSEVSFGPRLSIIIGE